MRQARRLSVYRVTVPDHVIAALLASGRLTDEEALNKAYVELQLSSIAEEWASLQPQKNRHA